MRGGLWISLGLAAASAGCSRPVAREGQAAPAKPPAPTVAATPEQRAILATLPAPYRDADLYNGQAKFALCKSCHTTQRGVGAALGPNLWGVFGRRSGAAPGYAYSEGLKRLGVTWTPQTLDSWIADPRAVVPGTKMAYAGLEDPRDRIDVVA
ncbi:MAG TPA: cytochrome c family protein, partial [Caulobacteraceae bacterium]|nr:cytochrome c family protein [Caulobacteraceae bacterium]